MILKKSSNYVEKSILEILFLVLFTHRNTRFQYLFRTSFSKNNYTLYSYQSLPLIDTNMKINRKLIITLLIILIFLPFFEFGLDYLFGDKDGNIVIYRISSIIKFIQILIILFVSFNLYRLKTSYAIFFIALVYFVIDFGIIGRILYDYEYIHRHPHPYVGFTGKPERGPHNELGFLGPKIEEASNEEFTIAFFGGSTGYRGNPNLPILLQKSLQKNNFMNGKVFMSNFSTESSNHNQHLHMLLEYLLNNKVDLVIFYGGWNETAAQTAYDPRPGYPINFFYIHDEPHWKKMLIENSKIFGALQHKIVNREKYSQIVYSNRWNKNITHNYFETLNKAKKITTIIEPNLMDQSNFLAFYQPFNLDQTKNIIPIHMKIKSKCQEFLWLHDISDVLLNINNAYTDAIHANHHSREIIAETMSKLIIKSYLKSN